MIMQDLLSKLRFLIHHCRDETRYYLKEQLDSIERPYQKFVKNVEESRQLAEEDRKGAELEKEQQQQQRSHMMRFRDDNKMVKKLPNSCNPAGITKHSTDYFSLALILNLHQLKHFSSQ